MANPNRNLQQDPPTPMLLNTKLNMPLQKANFVIRQALINRLTEGLQYNTGLFLISAPAGYGKTTLVSEWFNSESFNHTWLSLDEKDNDPIRFLTYLLAAIQRVVPLAGQTTQSFFTMPNLPQVDVLLTPLINDLTDLNERILVAIDDYHLIQNRYIHDIIQFILDNRPSLLHLVLITREDPLLSFPRMRAGGVIIEIRAGDLRFSEDEAATFLTGTMKLNLENEAFTLLNMMTEGWIAGLQLAALSLQGHSPEEITSFVVEFSGSNRYITDYLVSEVLANLPKDLGDFIHQTAVLDRLCAPLCNAITGREDSQALLELLEGSNIFLFPLDNQRQWYRYHHLFADLLRKEFGQAEQQLVHQKAARWFEANGYPEDAVNQAIAAADYQEAGRLIEMVSSELLFKGHLITLRNWINALPDDFVHTHNGLALIENFVLYFTGQIETVIPYITALENIPHNHFSSFNLGRLYTMRTILANDQGDPHGREFAEKALNLVKDSDIYYICTLSVYGKALRYGGNLNEAIEVLNKGVKVGQKHGYTFATILILKNLLFALELKGQRYDAVKLGESVLAEMIDHRGSPLPLAKILYLPLGLCYYQANDLEQALKFLIGGIDLCRQLTITRLINWGPIIARVYYALGDPQKALTTIREVIRETGQSAQPLNAFENTALEAELLLHQGELHAVANWVELWGLKPDDKPTPSREQSYFTFVRFLLAQERFREASNLLNNLESSTKAGQRNSRLIIVYILEALTHNLSGDGSKGLGCLSQAIKLAVPEGYYRPFLDEGPTIAAMLHKIQAFEPEFVTQLLKSFTKNEVNNSIKPFGISMIVPLSCREKELLRLIAAGLSNEEITQALALSINTTKWHIYNIFQKLSVNNRTQAVIKAKELDLI